MPERSPAGHEALPAGELVLVVDDDQAIRALIRELLEGEGLTELGASDHREALAAAADRRPALVLLDLNLKGDDHGVAVAADLRQLHGAALPIIVSSTSPQLVQHAAEIGALAYLAKPFEVSTLVETVQWALGGDPPTAHIPAVSWACHARLPDVRSVD